MYIQQWNISVHDQTRNVYTAYNKHKLTKQYTIILKSKNSYILKDAAGTSSSWKLYVSY